ncbi:hypothetical protein N8392_00900 [Candidatus Poseidonia sp.]|nr:hypothetical protein [Poseidonia sp.]
MGRRDPRADVVDDDPFQGIRSSPKRVHRVHQHMDRDGTVHIDAPPALASAMAQFFGQDTWAKPQHHTGKIWHFSDVEKQHLRQAMGAFTIALGLMMVGGLPGLNRLGTSTWVVMFLLSLPVMFVAVGPAFLFHEIGHKLVAKRNGCWAEFRADPKGLQFGVVLSLLLGFLFMAPGAVMVAGLVSRRQNGHIAVAGPMTNLGLFLIGIPLWGLILGLTGAFETASELGGRGEYLSDGRLVWKQMLIDCGAFWLGANLALGLFNMLPFGPLDGLKVRDWNEGAFFAAILIFIIPAVAFMLGYWSPTGLLTAVADPISNLIR